MYFTRNFFLRRLPVILMMVIALRMAANETDEPRPRVVPVSLGDAVIEFFMDGNLRAWSNWSFYGHDASATQLWASIRLQWQAAAAGEGPVLRRRYPGDGVELGPYSQLLFSAGFPLGTTLEIAAETDAGTFTRTFVCDRNHTVQHILPMPEAARLRGVTVTLGAAGDGEVVGSLFWLGVRDPRQRELERERWQFFSQQPLDVFLRDTPEPADAAPLYHLLASSEGFREASENARAGEPEPLGLRADLPITPHIGGANQNLFGRTDTDVGRGVQALLSAAGERRVQLLDGAVQAALIGDTESLREVAKAAVRIALIPHWDVDFVTDFPDSGWVQGAFQQSMVCYQLAVALDMAGAWLTPAGVQLIMRRLVEHGLGFTNYDLWRNRHRHISNQLPVFSMGRLAVYSAMEKQQGWSGTAAPYTDLAFAELNECLERIMNEDGGFFEGSAYLAYTLAYTLPALAIYATARDLPLAEVLPPPLAGTDDYLEALRSTTGDWPRLIFVSSGQGGPFAPVSVSTLALLAKIRPGGAAARMLAKIPEHRRDYELWALPAPDLTGVNPDDYEPLVTLPVSGLAASTRRLGENWLKLVVVGNSAGHGHHHEDRGSFVLEFAGENVAMDPGGLNYAHPESGAMRYAQNHNMLTPVGAGESRPAPIAPFRTPVLPEATGDATAFHATIEPGVLWPDHYRHWRREFASPTPETIIITDDYELKKGEGVEFRWHTPLAVREEDGKVIVQGERGRTIVTPPAGAAITIIPTRQLGNWELASIIFTVLEPAGVLRTGIRFESLAPPPE